MQARLLAGLLALACAWLAPCLPAAAQAGHADITLLRAERAEEGLLVSATLRFDLPTAVEDALAKGIPMFFVAEATLFQDRWYWADKRVASAQRHMRLSYQPLTRRWRLQVSASAIGPSGLSLGQTFDTREEALAAVQRIVNWKIADLSDMDPDGRHWIEFRFRLDVSQLPRPFQIGALGQAEWNIGATRALRLAPEAR